MVNGLASNVFYAERSYFLLTKIGEHSPEINKAKDGIPNLFAAFQDVLQTDTVISVSKLFDNPNPRYKVRCIKAVLDFAKDNIHEMGAIKLKDYFLAKMEKVGIESTSQEDQILIKVVLDYYYEWLEVNKPIIQKLKKLRDKRLAHNERTEEATISGPMWMEIENLLNGANDLVYFLGLGFTDYLYQINDEFTLTDDARRPIFALDAIFEKMGIK